LGSEATLVTDTKRTVVIAYGMNATNRFGKGWDGVAITTHIPVVRSLTELVFTCLNEVLYGEVLVAARGRTVDYDELHIRTL
jgi:hypothetical protein